MNQSNHPHTSALKECISCGKDFEPYLINESNCLNCSIEVNDHLISLNTDITGYCKNKKLLRRRYQLRYLRPIKHHNESLINRICKGCGENFVTKTAFKDRLEYCTYCQKLRLNLTHRS